METRHLSVDDVRGMAEYARIGMGQAELVDMTADLNAIVESLGVLTEYDLAGVAPTFHPIGGLVNVTREDVEQPGFSQEQALANAPKAQDGAFLIPSILGAHAQEASVAADGDGGCAGGEAEAGAAASGAVRCAERVPAASAAASSAAGASDGFAELGIADIQRGLRTGELSARELTEAAYRRIERIDPSVHAFLELTPELAFAAADATDKEFARGHGQDLGVLAGVPVAFKDNMNLTGTHTTCASRMLESYVSPYTATCVERVLAAGGIPLGKLNMDEFAFGSSTETSAFGCTCNPRDLARVPGGSSGGSAAAVAAGMACVTLGSDTGGSIRQPASFCGVVGVKPTYGAVSRYGVVAFGSSLDQVGPFARSVEDAALCMNALVAGGRDLRDCTSQDMRADFTQSLAQGVRGMRIGIVPEFMDAPGLDREVKVRIEEAALALRAAGAELVEVELPHAKAAMSAYYVLGPCEAFSNLARFDSVRYGHCASGHADLGGQYEASRAAGFGAEARRRILLGSYLLGAGVYDTYYYPAQQVRTLITQDYAAAFGRVDCILAPTSPRTAFRFGEVSDPVSMHLADMFTISINIAGNGGMSVPVGLGAETGLPVGAQLIAPAFRDENMFRAAAVLEQAYGRMPVADVCRTVSGGVSGNGAAKEKGGAR